MHLIALHDGAGSILGPKFLYFKSSPFLKVGLAFILPNFKPDKWVGPHNPKWYTTVFSQQNNIDFKLDGNFVTGFSDAEGSFIVQILRNKNLKVGWTIKTRFSISLHEKDLTVLELIKSYLGNAGNISKQGKDSVQYRVASLQNLTDVIIPHFNKYPLITKKKADFILFKKVVEMMNGKEHLTKEGLEKIVSIKGSINLGLSSELKAAFPNITIVERPVISNMLIQSPYWLAGFSSGEGSFMIKVKNSASYLAGYQVILEFQLAQHNRDIILMKSLINYLDCGVISEYKQIVLFKVTKLSDISNKIMPFFIKYPILGVKYKDFSNFCQVAELMHSKAHLTPKGLEKILNIKQRKITEQKENSKDKYLVTETKNILDLSSIKVNKTLEEDSLITPSLLQGGLSHSSPKNVESLANRSSDKRKLSYICGRFNPRNVKGFTSQEVKRFFFKRTFLVNVKPKSRIGPHHEDVISVLVGSLLGDGHAERLQSGGIRFRFRQQVKHKEYILWLYDFFNKRGYCTNNLPVLYEQKYGDKIYQSYRFGTYGFSSWMWLYKLFYTNSKIKVVPENIADLLTPLVLAIWIMDDGTWKPGVRIATNCFTKQEVELLALALETKFNLKCTLQKNNNKHQLYIKQGSLPLLKKLILPYMVPSMLYKLGL